MIGGEDCSLFRFKQRDVVGERRGERERHRLIDDGVFV